MIPLHLILEAISNQKSPFQEIWFTGAEIDSRKVIPGSLFIALPGERTDGHSFIADAFKNGATAAIIQKDIQGQYPLLDFQDDNLTSVQDISKSPFCIRVTDSLKSLQNIARNWRRELDLRVIGITGSVGKSTTKELVAEVLSQKYHTYKNPGNYNNEIGLPLTLLNTNPGHQYAVLEMGFYYPGEIAFLCDIALPQVGIVTNIGTVHAERAGTQDEIVKGKTELVRALPASPEGCAILNFDDPLVKKMANDTKARVMTYGTQEGADFRAFHIISRGLEGIEFDVQTQKGVQHYSTPLLGRHSAMTCLRAIATASLEGLTFDEIRKGLVNAQSQLRMTVHRHSSGAIILDDAYNATPESVMSALDLMADIHGRHVAVLGDMLELGEYEQAGHEKVGIRAAETCDILITIGPRSKMIVDAAIKNGLGSQKVHWFENAVQALDLVRQNCEKNSIVLVKASHGMRLDRITATLKESE